MAKLTNTAHINREIKNKVVRSIQNNCKPIVDRYLKKLLSSQVDSRGSRFPQKKESTKKQYRRHGWNTEQWLIRTGAATQLKYRNVPLGLRATPSDPEDILQYVKRADDWFSLNASIKKEIVNKIKEDLK